MMTNTVRERDEEAMMDRIHKTNGTEKQQWDNTYVQKRNFGPGARHIGKLQRTP